MKQFLLFAYAEYNAQGGMDDLAGDFATLAEAKAHFRFTVESLHGKAYSPEHAHIFDLESRRVVARFGSYVEGQRMLAWFDTQNDQAGRNRNSL